MLERLAAWFLNTYVAEYVGNIDTDQLSIGLLKGAVELEKLPLKRDSLKNLRLPFDIKGGYIGKLKLQIPPVRYIKSQPWVVQIDKLYIIAGPPSKDEAYNAEEEERLTQAQKQAKLDKLEQQWKADQQKSNNWWFWSAFSVTFPSSVIENLQVIVDDVHIRYEDTEANPSQPFAVGVTLENVSAQSTDEDWEPKFVSGGSKSRKLVDLKGFSVYFDTDILGELEGQQLEVAMLQKKASVKAQECSMTTSTMDGLQSSVQYVVKPVNGQAKLTRNSSKLPLKISNGARFHLEVHLEKIPIILSDQQYELMAELFDVFNLRVKARKFRRWRPASGVLEGPRERWKFAISYTLSRIREKNERRSKNFALKRAHQNVLYVDGYMLHLTQGLMSEEVIEELKEIEKEQSFEELAALRKLAMDQVKQQRGPSEVTKDKTASETEKDQGILQRWFPGWMSGKQTAMTSSPSPDSSAENMADDISAEEDELLNELGYDSQDDLLRRDRIFLTLSFSLVGGSLQLVTMPTSMTSSFFGPVPLVELAFESLCFAADLRPKLRYASFDLSLGSVTLQDHSDPDSLFPVLIQPMGAKVETTGKAPLFQRQYTVLDPLDLAKDCSLFVLKTTVEDVNHQKLYQVQVHSNPLDIVYNPSTIFKVKEFVTRPIKKRQTMRELGSHTTAELRNRIGDMFEGDSKVGGHRLLSIQLDISAPHILLPENFHDKDTSLVILDLGHVTFVNVPDWSADNLTTAINQEVIEMNEDDDDVWETPPSSPPSEQEETNGAPCSQPVKPVMLQSAIHSLSTLLRLRNDPFERYSLSLSDFQILVGKVDENWKEVTRTGQSSLHLLDKFTLSVRIQRILKFIPDSHQAILSVTASLPSLRFHIDENKVHTLISCFQAMNATNDNKPLSLSPESDTPITMASSMYLSAYSSDSFDLRPEPSMGVSMYQSAVESFFKEESFEDEESFVKSPPNETDTMDTGNGGIKETHVTKEKLRRRSSVVDATEKQLVARLTIEESLLSISSKDRVITELNMPGVSFEFLKRPYDTAIRLLLSDLCLVDRIQKFGPEYELVVCSSGRTLLGLSPFSSSTTKSGSSFKKTMAAGLEDSSSHLLHPNSSQDVFGSSPSFKSLESISTDVFSESNEELSGMLLALTYTHVSPCSPEHPAMKDMDQEEERSVDLDKEADIHKINLMCTAIDALANQETIVELIDFFQRVLPDDVMSKGSDASLPANEQKVQVKESKKPLQTEVNVKFERVGIRLLQRCQPRTFLETRPVDKDTITPSRLIASIMLYGLAAEGRISTDMAINGKLEGVHITDLTPEGKKYADILKMGLKKESLVLSPGRSPQQEGDMCLSFSISHSARSAASAFQPHPLSDVHINVFVPAIYYTHSVNFVYELEMFISELQLQSSHVTSSFRTAAVGVAKGIVSEKSRLTERLVQLHSSFGHMTSHVSLSQDEGNDEPDVGVSSSPLSDRIYLDISVQSPVIVVPRSLRRDECLVAHLGEIMLKNEFVQKGEFPTNENLMTSSFYVDNTLPEVDRVMLKINNVSLHSTHTQASRDRLLASHHDSSSSTLDSCFKVLKETSLLIQIDRSLRKHDDGHVSSDNEEGTDMDDGELESDADIVISGEICDPLLINLPKEVFDQIRATLKHSIRRTPPKFPSSNMSTKIDKKNGHKSGSSLTSKLLARTVRFDPNVQQEQQEDKLPKIFASFHLPKLSLELKHTLDDRETNLVFVFFEDFSLQCTKSDPHITSFDLALKSIVIEDLLQPEHSEYRYILASSSKPLPFISPVPSPTRSLRKFSKNASLTSSFSRHLFPVTHLMSTPKPPTPTRSPLRCFSPNTSLQNSSDQSSLKYSQDDQSASSTLKDEDTTANVSEIGDLLTVKAFHVSQKCPVFKSKYNSVSINAAVDFSSVFVIINLQTWVLLFDYLGIGIPTPPPSRPSTPEPPDLDSSTDQDSNPPKVLDPQTFTQYRNDSELNFEPQMTQSTMFASAVDQSILEDARDMASIGSNDGVRMFSSSSQSFPAREGGEPSETEGSSMRPDSLSFDSFASLQDKSELDSQSGVWGVEGKTSMEVGLNVKSLTVTFNKQEHPLAKGNVSSVTAQLKTNKGNLEISGTLGQASVMDLTETGAFYRERFTTAGEQALTFKIFKYGRPDPMMERPYDIRAEVNMGSVRYLHTMRFLKEILAFVSHFPQLIDAFQRMKAMAQGNLVYLGPERKARISLDVDIVGPVLLIPKHAFSPDLIVGDIGRVRVTNLARYDGQEGTLAYMRDKQGLDTVVSITGSAYGAPNSPHKPKLSPQSSVQSQLTTVSVDTQANQTATSPLRMGTSQVLSPSWFSRHTSFPSLRSSWMGQSHPSNMDNSLFGSFQTGVSSFVEKDRQRIEEKLEEFKGPCLLDCIEVELTEVDVFSAKKVRSEDGGHSIVRQPGQVLKEKGAAKIFIERNLYEDFCRDVPDLHIEGTLEAIHAMIDKSQLEIIKGLIDMNLGEPIEEFEKPSNVIRDPIAQPVAADIWTGFLFRMRFVGVTLELLQSRETDSLGSLTRSLARFDIQDSELTFESRSNQSKTVDFTSHSVVGYDTRYEGYDMSAKPSVFDKVLQPRVSQQQSSNKKKRTIQVEIHVSLSPKEIKASILLNKLRLIGIFDVILELKSFIFDKLSDSGEEDNFDEVDGHLATTNSLRQQLMIPKPQEDNKPPRNVVVKLSVTETDFVVVEDMTSLDSNAVVLKGTVILKFHQKPSKEKNINCSIDGLELFSCSLSNEDETALSILDPVSVSVDVNGQRKPNNDGSIVGQTLEVDIRQLNCRLSYNDIKLFLSIAQSLPRLEGQDQKEDSPVKQGQKEVDDALVKRLLPLGFTKTAIRKKLFLSDNNPDAAALRLLAEQERQESEDLASNNGWEDMEGKTLEEREKTKDTDKPFVIKSIEVNLGYLSVCLIDDSINRDVPLLDFSLTDLQAEHSLLTDKNGKARAIFAGDYYNRNISAWEPVVEPWKFELCWKTVTKYSTDLDSNVRPDRMSLALLSREQLLVNVTSSLIHILKVTQASWSQDLKQSEDLVQSSSIEPVVTAHRRTGSGRVVLEDGSLGDPQNKAISKVERGLALLHSVRFVSQTRQRSKFIPFLVRNNTGLPLHFATLTSVPSKVYVSPSALYEKTRVGRGTPRGVSSTELKRTSEWMEVSVGGEKPFDFSTKSKLRHRDTRALIVHQLLVKITGWQPIDIPISVDKIGVFFREVWPSSDDDVDSLVQLPKNRKPVRLVFAISLSDTQKVVNIRSALVLHNTMEIPLEVKLERPPERGEHDPHKDSTPLSPQGGNKSINLPPLSPHGYLAIPLHLLSWNIRVRPQGWGLQFCSKHLAWKHVISKLPTSHSRGCDPIGEEEDPTFRFCVSVERENYPVDSTPNHTHPAHTLTLYPPLAVVNLLPCDVEFILLSHHGKIRKKVYRGKQIALYSVDSMKPIDFTIAMEGFEHSQGCTVSLNDVGILQSLSLEDSNGRPLRLSVNSDVMGGSALKVTISCSYWLINRTGLPLVFRQEGVGFEAVGQHEEHERASTTTPLLFSYSAGEFVEKCTMRLGEAFCSLRGGQATWCSPFSMISDCGVRRVFMKSRDGRPDREYQIGVEIQRGRRQYGHTRVVTFVARYQLENRTQYRLAYLQRHQLHNVEQLTASNKIAIIMPRAIMAFHWPRNDLDQLLCIRVEDIDCQWSGGFPLDNDNSFHVHMRGRYSHSVFIRCNISLKGATYHVIFSDAANYPGPFRLENLSQIPITYYQSGVSRSSLVALLNPGQSVPYAWDEPTLAEKISIEVKGTKQCQEFDFERFGPRGKLYYECYFYITAVATFHTEESSSMFHGADSSPAYHRRYSEHSYELVLDVPQGTAVIFQKKDPERRTQLWRMSASRQLVHIVSSDSSGTNMVLDIVGGRLPTRGEFVALCLNRSSSVRKITQSWRFSEDGRLLIGTIPTLCVQSRPGYEALREGADAVLGFVSDSHDLVPSEQLIRKLKHSPGSGVLSVNIISDGPTRMLRITDENKKYSHTTPRDDWVVVDSGQIAPSKTSDVDSYQDNSWDSEEEESTSVEVELSLVLEQGVGVSLINSIPEELLFASLKGIRVEFISTTDQQCLNATIQHIQVDNQLATCVNPVLAYPSPDPTGSHDSSYPVVKLCVEKVPHKSPFTIVFKTADVKLRGVTLLLEERLLFKILQWAGIGQAPQEAEAKEEEFMNLLTRQTVSPSSSDASSRQLYLEDIKVSDVEFQVSMLTTSQLPDDLKKIKRHLGFPLIQFESPIYLREFHQSHILGNTAALLDAFQKHYKQALKSQAFALLGSVDFLGNPVGLLSDVATGVSGMVSLQPDVVGLVRNVAHGVSNTTSKLTGTVSHVLGKATFDSSFQEERQQLIDSCQTSGDHFKAGVMGFASGVFGGATSLITQPYKGAQDSGLVGFVGGMLKGAVGTVAKPVAGLFDFASGTTAALRETTSRFSRHNPSPVRLRRSCVGASGALTTYSMSQSRGQEYLLRLTDGKLSEKLVSYELLYENMSNRRERMKVIISSQYLYFFQDSPPDPSTVDAKISLDELAECRAAVGKTSIPTIYIVLSLINNEVGYSAPKYKCFDEKSARKVAQLINYAKNLHEEEKLIVRTLRLQHETIW